MRIELSTFMLTAAMLAACSNDSPTPQPQPEPPFVEPPPERVVYTQANVVYYGDEGYTGISDLWKVMLYTDMEIDPAGNLVGPGKLICISCNAPLSEGMDLDALAGTYTMSQSSNDFSAGTFNDGRLIDDRSARRLDIDARLLVLRRTCRWRDRLRSRPASRGLLLRGAQRRRHPYRRGHHDWYQVPETLLLLYRYHRAGRPQRDAGRIDTQQQPYRRYPP